MSKLKIFSTTYERLLLARWSSHRAASFELEGHYEKLRENNKKLLAAGLLTSIVASFGLLGSKDALTAQFGVLAVAAPLLYANERKRMTLKPAILLYRAREELQTRREDLNMIRVVANIHHRSSRADHVELMKGRIETASDAFLEAEQACRKPEKTAYTTFLNLKLKSVNPPFKMP